MNSTYSLEDLRYLMQRLRDKETGCPWDIQQDFRSITASTIEEAYEVVDAIEYGSKEDVKEELGDLLFQIIFYNQLAEEEGSFGLEDIIHALTAKLIRRHPHVFPQGNLNAKRTTALTEDDIKAQWETIKAQERQQKKKPSLLDDIPVGLPAITRAVKLQKRATAVNLDWPSAWAVFDKVDEEITELKEAVAAQDACAIEQELGDVLFSVVNLARHLKVQPEGALRAANKKFSVRVEGVHALAKQKDIDLLQASAKVLDDLWRQVKASNL
ncbi:nucleoside triphosphate pyrophosphohydrolase [Marinagarivorans algicola]|uniref:nucleoside triphosphate pyrophosphohydrolase n=1 Tax=Marinagarivorans algicola TaxID=1513270 RepID=UPI003735AAA2